MTRSRSQRFQSGNELAMALRVFLDRWKPGFRRSHFGRFMRKEFADEIERELRLLEEYVIDAADPTKVGENLLADVLPSDAPYTKFTAAVGEAQGTPAGTTGAQHPSASLPPLPDLHAQPTRILMRDEASSLEPLHALETHILTGAPESPSGDDDTTAGAHRAHQPLSALETKILARPPQKSLHELQTRILPRPTGPDPSPKVVVQPEEVDEDEQTTVPLADDDLEPA